MWAKVSIFVIVVLGVHLSLNGVSSATIMCYQCNSYPNNSACSDPMGSNISMITCSSDYDCTKVVYTTNGTKVTSRSCDLRTNDTCGAINQTLFANYPDLSGFSCSTCSTNHCNSGVTFGVSLAAMAAVFVAIKLT